MSDINIGAITEALNDKLDRDAGNPEAVGKKTVVGWGLPDYTAGVSISSGYVATEKCWLGCITYAYGAKGTAGYARVSVNGAEVSYSHVTQYTYTERDRNMVPLDVGDVVTVSASLGDAYLGVYPMKGV